MSITTTLKPASFTISIAAMSARPSSQPFVCARCLRQLRQQTRAGHRHANSHRRTYSSTPTPTNPPPPPPGGIAHLPNRRLLSLSGPDAPKFLQGLTTNNVSTLQASGWYTAFLNAQGRVLYDCFVYPTFFHKGWREWVASGKGGDGPDWGCFVEVDAGQAEGLVKHLKRHKLRSKVDIRPVQEDEWAVWAGWREGKEEGHVSASEGEGGIENADQSHPPESDGPIQLKDPRVPGFGSRVLTQEDTSPADSLSQFEGVQQADLTSYTLRRYLHGIPEGPLEIPPQSALPQESNIDYMSGIDFRKGCYVGQELTIRTHHTGVVRKRILPVQLYPPSSSAPDTLSYDPDSATPIPPTGTDIKKVEGRGRSAGRFITGIGNVGLALCRLEMMTDVKLTAEGGGWMQGTEFQMSWGEQQGAEGEWENVRIKAFVPEWHRGRERIKKGPRRVE